MLGEFTGQNQSNTGDALDQRASIMIGPTTYEVWISREEIVDFLL